MSTVPDRDDESFTEQESGEPQQPCSESFKSEESLQSQSPGSSRSSQPVTKCEVCTKVAPKYTCPGCGLKTCSLPCVKEHKIKLSCNGERNKFAFVDMSEYSDRHLLNDYRFLENAERSVYSNKIVPKNRRMNHNIMFPYHQNKRSKILSSAAYRRGVRLSMMPNNLSKHKSNTSFYTISSDMLEWHIEWHFISSSCLIKDSRVPETTILVEAAEKFANAVEFPHLRKSLEDYRKRFHKCRFLMKVEGLPANRKRFIELKRQATIGDNLKGLSLLEYPTILILPPSYAYSSDDYQLLDKDTDLTHMHIGHMKHLTRHHPNYCQTEHLENQLVDPNSNVYQPENIVDVDAE